MKFDPPPYPLDGVMGQGVRLQIALFSSLATRICYLSTDQLIKQFFCFRLSDSDLIQKLLNILCERKQLKLSHLHVLLHSNIKHLDLSVCSSLITDQILSAVGCRCEVCNPTLFSGHIFLQITSYLCFNPKNVAGSHFGF